MWRTIIHKGSKGNPDNISYKLKCDICGKLFSQHGEVVKFKTIQDVDSSSFDFYGWFVMGDGALCPECRQERYEDDDEMDSLHLISFDTWCKRNGVKKTVVTDRRGDKTWVWPTLKEHGFKIYNKDPDIRFFNEKPKDTVYRVIDRGGSPTKRVALKDVEFVYAKCENCIDDLVCVYWRKAK